jgi:ankyrin repeat protein
LSKTASLQELRLAFDDRKYIEVLRHKDIADSTMKILLAFVFMWIISAAASAQTSESKDNPDTIRISEDIELPQPPEAPEPFSQVEKAFIQSAYAGNLEEVKVLVAKGVDVDLRDQKKRTPLILAAHNGHTPIVEFLLDSGADVNAEDGDDKTALLYASKRSFNETVALLLEKGADVNAQSRKKGVTALMLAAVAGNEELVRMLLAHGADADIKDVFGRTAKILSEKKGNSTVVEMLPDPPAP